MFGKATLRGGQTLLHDVHMWGQLVRWQIIGFVLVVVLAPSIALYFTTTAYEWRLVGMGTLAEVKLSIGYSPRSGQMHEWVEGRKTPNPLLDIVADGRIERIRRRMLETVHSWAWTGAKWGVGGMVVCTLGFWMLGRRLARTRRVRGAEMATARELRRRVQPLTVRLATALFPAARRASCRIAGIPWPRRAETQHTIVSGTTGSGKTVLISDLVAQIRARGERCILYDKMGAYTRSFFDPAKDVLMNPLDARAPRWSPFFEARTPRDFDMMAAALIPQQKDTVDPFWVTAARQLFSNGAGVLWTQKVTENRRLVEDLLKTELSELAEAMEGTVAQSIVSPDNPKTALSVRAMLTAHLGALEFLPDTGERFSIRDWVGREDDTGFLFLTSRGDQHASLRGDSSPRGSRSRSTPSSRSSRTARAGYGSSWTSCRRFTRCRASSRALPSPGSSAAASCWGSRCSRPCGTSTGRTARRPSRGSAAPGWCCPPPTRRPRSGRRRASGAARWKSTRRA